MIENSMWSISGAADSVGVDIAPGEPSHIHIPRPSRVVRTDDAGTGARRRLAGLEQHIVAYGDRATSVTFEDPQAAGSRTNRRLRTDPASLLPA